MKTQKQDSEMNYWFFFIAFAICAALGLVGLVVGEMFLPDNNGGLKGRLAMYRSLGPMFVAWLAIALWAWYRIQLKSSATID